MNNFIAHTENERLEMLNALSASSIEDLFKQIPIQFKNFDMGNPLSELEAQKKEEERIQEEDCKRKKKQQRLKERIH